MGRLLLLLLFALPPLALWLDHEVISFLMLVSWTMLVIPLCILWSIDYVRYDAETTRSPALLTVLKVAIGLFGLFCFLTGLSIVLWCLYNLTVRRLLEYSGPRDWVEIALGGFGISTPAMGFGWYLMRLALGLEKEPEYPPEPEDDVPWETDFYRSR